MTEPYFKAYVFPKDDDVVFIGLGQWVEMEGNPTPVLGAYLCDAEEVNARFDELEADLRKARREALTKISKIQAELKAKRLKFRGDGASSLKSQNLRLQK